MQKLGNYITGNWINGDGEGTELYNAVNGNIITNATSQGLDFESVLKIRKRKREPGLAQNDFSGKRQNA